MSFGWFERMRLYREWVFIEQSASRYRRKGLHFKYAELISYLIRSSTRGGWEFHLKSTASSSIKYRPKRLFGFCLIRYSLIEFALGRLCFWASIEMRILLGWLKIYLNNPPLDNIAPCFVLTAITRGGW